MPGNPEMKAIQNTSELELENIILWPSTKSISLSNYEFPLQHSQREMSPVSSQLCLGFPPLN